LSFPPFLTWQLGAIDGAITLVARKGFSQFFVGDSVVYLLCLPKEGIFFQSVFREIVELSTTF
jgi:hypothetical protein